MTTRTFTATALFAAALLLTACGRKPDAGAGDSAAVQPSATPATPGETATPDPGGKVIVVQMLTDDAGNNRFDPREIEAHQGDVIRYTLQTGVHNVNFLADSNTVKTGLPVASQMLQLPGQTFDVKVTLPPGKYYLQCDPHALLGMTGRLEVEEKP